MVQIAHWIQLSPRWIIQTKCPLDENSVCPEAKTSYWLIVARTISILTNTWMLSFVGIKNNYTEFVNLNKRPLDENSVCPEAIINTKSQL